MKYKSFFFFLTSVFLIIADELESAERTSSTNTITEANTASARTEDFVYPTIIPATKVIGGQVPLGFQARPVLSTQTLVGSGLNSGVSMVADACACAARIPTQCPMCTASPTPEIYQEVVSITSCTCAPKLNCPPCPPLYAAVHEMALRQASMDAKAQENLQEKAQDQVRLYGEAQKFALEMQEEEKKALEAAQTMNAASGRAELARQKMIRANMRAREIAQGMLYPTTIPLLREEVLVKRPASFLAPALADAPSNFKYVSPIIENKYSDKSFISPELNNS